MLRVVHGNLAPVPQGDLDPDVVQEVQRKSNGYSLDVLKARLGPRNLGETTPGGSGYVVPDAAVTIIPCNVSNPNVVSHFGLSACLAQ